MTKIEINISRISILIVIAVAYAVLNPGRCSALKNVRIPDSVVRQCNKDEYNLILLFEKNICGTCPSANFLYRIAGDPNVVIIIPKEYTDNDIENIRIAFNLRGLILRGDQTSDILLKKIAPCYSNNNTESNFLLKIVEKNKINEFRLL